MAPRRRIGWIQPIAIVLNLTVLALFTSTTLWMGIRLPQFLRAVRRAPLDGICVFFWTSGQVEYLDAASLSHPCDARDQHSFLSIRCALLSRLAGLYLTGRAWRRDGMVASVRDLGQKPHCQSYLRVLPAHHAGYASTPTSTTIRSVTYAL